MSTNDDQREPRISSLEGIGVTGAWTALGTVMGQIIALGVPDSVITDPEVSGLFGVGAGALAALGVLTKLRRRPLSSVEDCLNHADKLFLKDKITENEYTRLRRECLEKG